MKYRFGFRLVKVAGIVCSAMLISNNAHAVVETTGADGAGIAANTKLAEESDVNSVATSTAAGITSAAAGITANTSRATSAAAGITSAATGITSAATGINSAATGINSAATGINSAAAGITSARAGITSAAAGITANTSRATSAAAGITSARAGITSAATAITANTSRVTSAAAGINSAAAGITSARAGISTNVSSITSAAAYTTSVKNSAATAITSTTTAITSATTGITSARAGITSAAAGITSARAGITSAATAITANTSRATSAAAGITSARAGISTNVSSITSAAAYTTSVKNSAATAITSTTTAITSATTGITAVSTATRTIERRMSGAERGNVAFTSTDGSQLRVNNQGVRAQSADGKSVVEVKNGEIRQTVTNAQGKSHGLVINGQSTTLSGGANSTYMTLNDKGVRFGKMGTNRPVKVTGVADGEDDYDAVNFRQLDKVNKGVAMGIAMDGIPQNFASGNNFAVGVGVGRFNDQNAAALGMFYRDTDWNLTYSLKVAHASGNKRVEQAASLGIGWSF